MAQGAYRPRSSPGDGTPTATVIEVFGEPILHVDMDAFFVEVERLAEPSLVGRAVAVGGGGRRGVVASASYEARRFGVRSAMPMARARRLCPGLVVVPPDHSAYRRMSERVFTIFRSFTPRVEGVSVDEAFLDVSGLRLHFEHPVAVGREVRGAIRRELDLPASVGVASTKLVAKLASEEAKPDGLCHVPVEEALGFLHARPVRALWGVGESTHAALERLGVATVGDLAAVPSGTLRRSLGPALADHLLELAAGHDPREVVPDSEAKSVSVEQTFEVDVTDHDVLTTTLLAQADRLASRLRRAGLRAGTVTLKVRFGDFATITRSQRRSGATAVARDLYRDALALWGRVENRERAVRLLGLAATHLEAMEAPRQLEVGDGERWGRLAGAVDVVRARFGPEAVLPARLRSAAKEATPDRDGPLS